MKRKDFYSSIGGEEGEGKIASSLHRNQAGEKKEQGNYSSFFVTMYMAGNYPLSYNSI